MSTDAIVPVPTLVDVWLAQLPKEWAALSDPSRPLAPEVRWLPLDATENLTYYGINAMISAVTMALLYEVAMTGWLWAFVSGRGSRQMVESIVATQFLLAYPLMWFFLARSVRRRRAKEVGSVRAGIFLMEAGMMVHNGLRCALLPLDGVRWIDRRRRLLGGVAVTVHWHGQPPIEVAITGDGSELLRWERR